MLYFETYITEKKQLNELLFECGTLDITPKFQL